MKKRSRHANGKCRIDSYVTDRTKILKRDPDDEAVRRYNACVPSSLSRKSPDERGGLDDSANVETRKHDHAAYQAQICTMTCGFGSLSTNTISR